MKATTRLLKAPIQRRGLAPTLIFVVLMVLSPANAPADTIVFDTFGPGNTYDANDVFNIVAPMYLGGLQEQAIQFTAGASGPLASLDLGLTHQATGPAPINAYLYGDAAGSPDNANQTFLGSGTPTEYWFTNTSIVSIAIVGNVSVTAGSLYWLVLKPGAADTFDTWNFSSPQIMGNAYASNNDSAWYGGLGVLPAFRITALSTVGVPDLGSTWMLLLLGLTAMCGLRLSTTSASLKPGKAFGSWAPPSHPRP
jgi:hypothetical protein